MQPWVLKVRVDWGRTWTRRILSLCLPSYNSSYQRPQAALSPVSPFTVDRTPQTYPTCTAVTPHSACDSLSSFPGQAGGASRRFSASSQGPTLKKGSHCPPGCRRSVSSPQPSHPRSAAAHVAQVAHLLCKDACDVESGPVLGPWDWQPALCTESWLQEDVLDLCILFFLIYL